MDCDIETGKRIYLRPATVELSVSDMKKKAQDFYYNNLENVNHLKKPVHQRLGKKKQKLQGRKAMYYLNNNSVKSRTRKGQPGGITTHALRQRAQARLNQWQQKFCPGLPMCITFKTNKKSKYPSLYHSVKDSLNVELQTEIKAIMINCRPNPPVENEIPLPNEDLTSMSLHQRFSTYP